VIFVAIALKLTKVGLSFSNEIQSMSILAILCNRQQETVSVNNYYWTIILGIQLTQKKVKLFKKI